MSENGQAPIEQRELRPAGEVLNRPFRELAPGDSFYTKARTITEADVVAFAALTGDWHPQHANAVYAEQSQFGERIAHGMLALSIAIGLVPTQYVMALRRLTNIVFKRPVFFGDTVHVEGVILRIRAISEDSGQVGARWRLVNQRGQTVFKMEIEALWQSQSAESVGVLPEHAAG